MGMWMFVEASVHSGAFDDVGPRPYYFSNIYTVLEDGIVFGVFVGCPLTIHGWRFSYGERRAWTSCCCGCLSASW